jgi:hypothetical protein
VAGDKFWHNAEKYQDTFATIVVADLAAPGGALHNLRPKAPRLSMSLVVEHFVGGHTSATPEGGLGPKDPRLVRVRYWDGAISTDRDGDALAADPIFRSPPVRVTL